MSMYFPKRLELSFFRVLAFPKAWMDIQNHRLIFKICFSANRMVPRVGVQCHRPQAPGWREAACPWRCSAVWYSGSWRRRTAGFSWRPRSCRLRSPLRSGWSGCWTPTAWCGRRCLPAHSCMGRRRRGSSPETCKFPTWIPMWCLIYIKLYEGGGHILLILIAKPLYFNAVLGWEANVIRLRSKVNCMLRCHECSIKILTLLFKH